MSICLSSQVYPVYIRTQTIEEIQIEKAITELNNWYNYIQSNYKDLADESNMSDYVLNSIDILKKEKEEVIRKSTLISYKIKENPFKLSPPITLME